MAKEEHNDKKDAKNQPRYREFGKEMALSVAAGLLAFGLAAGHVRAARPTRLTVSWPA